MTWEVSRRTGLVHGTRSGAAVACLDQLYDELLVYGLNAAVAFGALTHDPGYAAGSAIAAALHLLTMSPEADALARPLAAKAVALADDAPPRERLLIGAIAAWAGRRPGLAERHLRTLVARWPSDLVAARLLQVHQLNRADFRAMVRTTDALLKANPGVSHVAGMHAFALAEVGALDAANRLGRAAADQAFDPWAEHAVAHVFAARRDARGAIGWLLPRAGQWSRCSSFLYTHNWWHVALAQLAAGEREAALELFDERVWGVRKHYCQDQVNAVSLLARLELAGVSVGGRWAELGVWLAPRTSDHLNGLLDLHYLYGLARAGRDGAVAAMGRSLCERSRTSPEPVWREIMPVAAAGVIACARRQWQDAATHLAMVLPRLQQIGGSSVQRDLFHQLLVHARAAA